MEHMVSLAAPLPPETAEVQVIGCALEGMTPSEAALAGISFVLAFRGEQTEVSPFLSCRGLGEFVFVGDLGLIRA